ncbi:SIR2 family protein, partial [Archangium sp.]|uniref:SIR2 family NAD-dependent protein deacylase n=1 Tax=Archangium sp. TaxID=1872627 RepID=UPI002D5612AB
FIANKRATFATPLPLRTMLAELGVLKAELGRSYRDAMNRIFRPADAAPGPLHQALADLRCRLVLTANIDQLIEKADPARQMFTWRQAPDLLSDLDDGRDVLFKVHGSVETLNSLVMTQDEYDTASRDEPYQRTLSHLLQRYSFLFVGFSLVDPLDLERILESNARAFEHAARPHFALLKSPVGSNADRWRDVFNVHTIEYPDHGDVIDVLRRLKTA